MQKQQRKVSGTRGRYLYAIVADSQGKTLGCLGINGGNVYTISDGHVAAVVSDVPNQKIRPERRHLAAHQTVLKTLLQDGETLPVAFGIIPNSPKEVRGILSRNREAILEQLERVAGKVEMGLKVMWDVPNIFEYLVNFHMELRIARDKLFADGAGPTHAQKIELGRLFEEVLNSDRDRHFQCVEQVLAPRCFEIRRNACSEEKVVMNLACLVGRNALGQFEAGVLEAASFFDDGFAFDYNGPWPPHNFVELNVDI